MLVLSRRENQSFQFPTLGITVRVLQSQGSVKIGITAPRDVCVFRSELGVSGAPAAPRDTWRHELANRLNKVTLGLNLASRLLSAGRISDAGSRLEEVLRQLDGLNNEFQAPKPSAAPTVLVVEDDTNERELLAGLLGLDGWSVTSAPDGEAALEQLAGVTPNLILMDMQMPRCDGAAAIHRLRQSPAGQHVPVVVLSGKRPEDYGLAVGPGGVDGWYQKPIRPREVLPALRARVGISVN